MHSAAKAQSRQSPYELIALPNWVSQRPRPASVPDDTQSPQTYLLLDYQTLVTSVGDNSYQRLCYQIHDASCIEDLSQFLYTVRPESESVSLHRCVIYRDEQTIDCLDADNIRCMQRELQLESHVSSDALTIEFIIDDLRTGDIVDIETTFNVFKSDHPIHGHYIRQSHSLAWNRSVAHQIVRITNESPRNLVIHHADSTKDINDFVTLLPGADYEREWRDLPRAINNGNLPADYWPPNVFLSTETSWDEVSTHMYRFYNKAGVFESVDLADLELSEINEESLIKNIRFVQDNIRYRSECSGIFSHTPKLPSKTLKKRTGDCKDKSTLLLSVLRAMNVDAELALVSTGLRDAIETLSPSPYLFDHMIVHFKWHGKSYFVDATVQKQGGTLTTMENLPYKRALILKAQGGTLEKIPYSTDSIVYKLTQNFDLSLKVQTKPLVTYRRDYFGARADNMRRNFSANDLSSIQKSYHDNLEVQLSAKLTALKAIHIVNDDRHSNQFTTEESYLIDTPLSEIDEGKLALVTPFYQDLEISNTVTTPEQLFHDGESQQEINISHSSKPSSNGQSFQCENQWFDYRETLETKDKTVRLMVTIKPKSNRVEATQRDEYIQQVEVLKNRCTTHFPSVIDNTAPRALMFGAIALNIFFGMLALVEVIPGSPGFYILGISALYHVINYFKFIR